MQINKDKIIHTCIFTYTHTHIYIYIYMCFGFSQKRMLSHHDSSKIPKKNQVFCKIWFSRIFTAKWFFHGQMVELSTNEPFVPRTNLVGTNDGLGYWPQHTKRSNRSLQGAASALKRNGNRSLQGAAAAPKRNGRRRSNAHSAERFQGANVAFWIQEKLVSETLQPIPARRSFSAERPWQPIPARRSRSA